eukprot:10820819-Lingulodinium_polyedra.AAC.1
MHELVAPWPPAWRQDAQGEPLQPVARMALELLGRGAARRAAAYIFVDRSGPAAAGEAAGWA